MFLAELEESSCTQKCSSTCSSGVRERERRQERMTKLSNLLSNRASFLQGGSIYKWVRTCTELLRSIAYTVLAECCVTGIRTVLGAWLGVLFFFFFLFLNIFFFSFLCFCACVCVCMFGARGFDDCDLNKWFHDSLVGMRSFVTVWLELRTVPKVRGLIGIKALHPYLSPPVLYRIRLQHMCVRWSSF